MKTIRVFTSCIAVAAFVLPGATFAQDDAPPHYVSVDCMKSTSTDYVDVETDIWLPMHQARVDQGTIAAKLMGFGRCVNLTLGLPIVRTSADHGTAFERAGRGGVDHGSMAAAVALAAEIAARRAESS